MNAILEFYEQEAKQQRSKISWFADRQEKALREFQYRAFPTRHDEDWKYTLLDDFLKEKFQVRHPERVQVRHPERVQVRHPERVFAKDLLNLGENCANVEGSFAQKDALRMTLVNDQITFSNNFHQNLPKGLIVEPLLTALHTHEQKIKPWLGKLLQNEHGFHALNMASLQSGVFIYVPAHIRLEDPLMLQHWQDKEGFASHIRHLIVMEEGSELSILETYAGADSTVYFTNVITEAHIAAHAKLQHYKIQQESKLAYHMGHLALQQDTSSCFESHSLSLGSKLARMDLSLRFLAENAKAVLNGMYLPKDGQHMDHHTSIHHLAKSCESMQDYKGVLMGKSRAVFNGKILVGKGAVHTVARQQNKNLLLSKEAEIDTKPQLEIFADDVVCSHGATVGQLDEDALFYMATRGMDAQTAKSFLIQAFAADNLRLIPHKELANWMADLINEHLR